MSGIPIDPSSKNTAIGTGFLPSSPRDVFAVRLGAAHRVSGKHLAGPFRADFRSRRGSDCRSRPTLPPRGAKAQTRLEVAGAAREETATGEDERPIVLELLLPPHEHPTISIEPGVRAPARPTERRCFGGRESWSDGAGPPSGGRPPSNTVDEPEVAAGAAPMVGRGGRRPGNPRRGEPTVGPLRQRIWAGLDPNTGSRIGSKYPARIASPSGSTRTRCRR